MTENDWEFLMEVFDRLEAEIIKEALEAQGIPSELFQEGISHYLYPSSTPLPMGRIEICVSAARLDEARAWLESYNKGELRNDDAELGDPDNQ